MKNKAKDKTDNTTGQMKRNTQTALKTHVTEDIM